jgi:hypothetical protein
MSKGWKIYATIIAALTIVAILGTGGGVPAVVFGLAGNMIVWVGIPYALVQLVRRLRHKEAAST